MKQEKAPTKEAIEAEAGLLIVESDVVVKKNTLQDLFDGALARPDCAIAAAVTTDESGEINYPYLHAKGVYFLTFSWSIMFYFFSSVL